MCKDPSDHHMLIGPKARKISARDVSSRGADPGCVTSQMGGQEAPTAVSSPGLRRTQLSGELCVQVTGMQGNPGQQGSPCCRDTPCSPQCPNDRILFRKGHPTVGLTRCERLTA